VDGHGGEEFKTPRFTAAGWVLLTPWIEIQQKSKKGRRGCPVP